MTGFWQEDADRMFPEYMEARTNKTDGNKNNKQVLWCFLFPKDLGKAPLRCLPISYHRHHLAAKRCPLLPLSLCSCVPSTPARPLVSTGPIGNFASPLGCTHSRFWLPPIPGAPSNSARPKFEPNGRLLNQ